MFDRPSWLIYAAVFFIAYALAGAGSADEATRNERRNLVIAAGSLALYALWSVAAALILLLLCVGVYLYSQQSRFVRAVSAPLFIAVALGYLAFVKYWSFAADLLGVPWKHHFYVIGISFYVFTLVGYLVDTAYRRRAPLERFSHVIVLLSFWPHLAAGPILRLENVRIYLRDKLRLDDPQRVLAAMLIVGGLGKKLFLADNFGTYVNANASLGVAGMNGLEALTTLLGFAAQIYFDFSGYSDIAIGAAILMGFRLPANFDYPYRARSLEEFWSRWHISLSTWFRDYLYIPLGGSRRGNLYLNLMVVFTLSGLWHGAATSFVVWGGIHGLALCTEKLAAKRVASVAPWVRWLLTQTVVVLAWSYFRFNTTQANELLARIATPSSYHLYTLESAYYVLPIAALLPMLVVDHVVRYYRIEADGFIALVFDRRRLAYAAALFVLALLFSGAPLPFIYFQF
jgi:D-alanyl-lipoteichoic acid acyltransferase DltB (MBOAT superfamily)